MQRSQTETSDQAWPGRVFEDPELMCDEAMLDYVAACREREKQPEAESSTAEATGKGALKTEKRAPQREEAHLRDERRRVREKRKLLSMIGMMGVESSRSAACCASMRFCWKRARSSSTRFCSVISRIVPASPAGLPSSSVSRAIAIHVGNVVPSFRWCPISP